MKEPTLLVLAAGMGSRYGGLKQIDPLGPHGEIIIDYSLHDAYLAGFHRVVFVIKEELKDVFEEKVGALAREKMEVHYAFQKTTDLPEGCSLPEGRVKPWGTGQAVLCAKDVIDGPFGVINADDFYGRETYKLLYDFLTGSHTGDKMDFCMVGYVLKNTLTENGTVSRGVCQVKDGFLETVTERTKIRGTQDGGAEYTEDGENYIPLCPDSTVSMNVWGFSPELFTCLEEGFEAFLKAPMQDPLKVEYYLPGAVDGLIQQQKAQVHMLRTGSQWFGVTYPEDKDMVKAALKKAFDEGVYPPLR
ncbi:nucleotidyltransferase [Ruminococcaceae bacterium AM28-23LB]|nr:nucleotidyltransferase [Ruminococcaceae bacterium AM28-23LB]